MNNRAVKLALFFLVCTVFFGFSVTAHAQSAKSLYKQGETAEAKNDVETAYEDYYKAFQKDPKDLRYKTAYERTRFSAAAAHLKRGQKLRDQGDNTGALTEFLHALEIDPSNELAQQEIRATRDKMSAPPNQESSLSPNANPALEDIGGPPALTPLSNEPLTIHSVEDSKIVYQTVGKLAGINVLFDPEYTSKRIQVDLTNVPLYDALRILGTISGTFWRPITANTIFVAQNNRGKRAELDEQAVQTFYLTNVSQQQDLNDVQTALRNVFTTAKLYAVPSQSAIIMRGTPDELLLAQKLIYDLDKARSEVVVDVAVMEVNRDKTRQIGIQLPQTATINFQQSNANQSSTSSSSSSSSTTTTGTTTGGLTLNDLAHLNATNFAVTIGQAQVNLLLTDSDSKILQNPRIRASDGQEATLKIGEKYPVATGSYQTGAATAIVSSLVNTQFQYLDVGVNITMKPQIHYDRDVTMKMKIEVSTIGPILNLGGVSEPVILNNSAEETIRLKEGEASIIGGILTKSNNRSLSGWPGLAELPILRYIFGSETREVQDDEIVFLVIPHVVRAAQISPLNTRQIDTGTTNTIELRRIQAPVPPPQPAKPTGQADGQAVPGQTAPQAAANAVAQMQQQANAGAPVSFQLAAPPAPQKVGSSFQVAVNLSGGQDVFSVPLQMQYDTSKLSLINVDLGTFLGKDGQTVALVHRDDNGNVTISASRPPGVAGVSGTGSVVVLTFQAKAAGDASVAITRPVVRNSAQQALPATGAQAVVHVQ
ncbi:MAG TPA: cohesin domain-containing protein [Alloacidobacterium sp.]|nr:cohesin domain-containing protein [Alloacidobacterium sp.]